MHEEQPHTTPSPEARQPAGSLATRLSRALGPVLGALVLDFADLATFGPIGLVFGGPIGAGIGWWLGGMYHIGTSARVVLSALAAAYCMTPFTGVIPVATLLSALARFLKDPVSPTESENGGTQPPPGQPNPEESGKL